MTTKLKICGLKDESTIKFCEDLKVDYLGLNLINTSPRYVEPAECLALLNCMQSKNGVAVLKHENLVENMSLLKHDNICAVQIYIGNLQNEEDIKEHLEFIKSAKSLLNREIIYPILVDKSLPMAILERLSPYVDYFLFDTKHDALLGGSGKSFDWDILKGGILNNMKPFFVAGGINVENLEDVIASCSPYAVDIASGAETNGKKDFDKIKNIVLKIRS